MLRGVKYTIRDMIGAMVIGIVIGAMGVGASVADAGPDNVTQGELNRAVSRLTTANAYQSRAIMDLKILAKRACAIRQFEDGSATWERNDNERDMCLEFHSQIGR